MTSTEQNPYQYSEDFVSHWEGTWELMLGPLRGTRGLRILEIGSFEGRSAVWFLENLLTADDASIVCLDPFKAPWAEGFFDKNMVLTGVGNKVTKLKMRSDEYLAAMPEDRFDLVYVDGGHTAPTVLFDALLSWLLVKPGGILMFDDYEWGPDKPPHERPQISIDVFMAILAGNYEVLHEGYQILLRKPFSADRDEA